MPISKSPFRTARKSPRRPSTDGSVLSAACRSSARPASSCRIRARRGSPRSIRASTWRAPQDLTHIAGATGASSEAAVRKLYGLSDIALIDMGDFVGGMLKYLRRHPGAARHHRGRRRQDDEARAGPDRPALQTRRGRSRDAGRIRPRSRRLGQTCVRASSPPTRPHMPLRWHSTKASRSATRLRAPGGRP